MGKGERRGAWLAALVLLFGVQSVRTQYLEGREYSSSGTRYLYAGVTRLDFKPRSSNPVGDSLAIAFTALMPMIGFHQGLVDVVFGYTQYMLHGRSRSSIYLGTTVSTEVVISGRRESVLLLPVMLAADFTKAEANGAERDNFNIASVGIGAGLKYRYYTSSFDFAVLVGEAFHYSLEGLSTGSGSSAVTLADLTLFLKNVGILEGIVVGYRFRFQTWSMSEEQYNYRSLSHGPFLAVSF